MVRGDQGLASFETHLTKQGFEPLDLARKIFSRSVSEVSVRNVKPFDVPAARNLFFRVLVRVRVCVRARACVCVCQPAMGGKIMTSVCLMCDQRVANV